jgi:tetratricopeptide (TPR) repeat protein
VITDLVGSTGLASRVGPAVADELRHEHFAILRDGLDESAGREVKNMGDGLMFVFSSASGAVDCAVGMQQRLERRNRGAGEQLLVRVGIGMGEATCEDGDYFGMPTIEAARLCDKAGAGQILTGELVRMMAAGRKDCFAAAGTLELKGIPGDYQAYEVTWSPEETEAAAIPLPPLLQGVPPVGYVGREDKRELLARLRSEAREGSRRLALVSGEPGIGKTRLSTFAAVEAHGDGDAVLFGRCTEELGAPYAPWIEALGHLVDHAPGDVLAAHVARHGGEITRLVPQVAARVEEVPPPRPSDPDTERYLLFGAVLGLLEEACARVPIVLILDDLHWADAQSLALLRHVVSGAPTLPLLAIATFRDSEVGANAALSEALAALRREQGVERVALTGLGQDDVVELMEAAAGHELDQLGLALAGQIAGETDGNPFFVAELLRHLIESETLVRRDDGRWELKREMDSLGLPQSVREVVGRRVERLGERAVSILSIAAVIGREFDLDLLEQVVRDPGEEVLDVLESAVESAILVESGAGAGRFYFAHALISHTLYEQLGATRVARLHLRVAEALEELCGADPGPRLGELAHHWSAATISVNAAKAVDYSRRAAERALDELAPDEAVRWFTQALDLESQQGEVDPGERCDLLIGLGMAQRQAGEADYRTTLLEAAGMARERGDGGRMAAAALANSRGYTSEVGMVDDDRVEVVRAAIAALPAEDARQVRLHSLLAMEIHYGGTMAERRELSDQALEGARATGDPATVAHVIIDRWFALWTVSTAEERNELLAELDGFAGDLGDPLIDYWRGLLGFHLGLDWGDRDRVQECLARCQSLSDRVGEPFLRWLTMWVRGSWALVEGQLDEAESRIDEGVGYGMENDQGDAMIIYAAQLGLLRREQGRMDEVVEVLEASVEDNPGIPGFAALLALAYVESGRPDDAGALLDSALSVGFDSWVVELTWGTGICLYGEVAARLGHAEAAATIHPLLAPYADRLAWNGAFQLGSISHHLGMLAATLGRADEALERFAVAEEANERLGAPLLAARTRIERARTLLQQGGGSDEARQLLEQALKTAREHASPSTESQAEALLAGGVATDSRP